MDEQRQNDQLEPTYNSSVPIQDVALKTKRKRWTIEKGGGLGSVIYVQMVRHDDDNDIYIYIYIFLWIWRDMMMMMMIYMYIYIKINESMLGTLRSRFWRNCSSIVPTRDLIFVIGSV